MNEKDYMELTKKYSSRSPKLKDMCFAFLFGGIICSIGQLFFEFYFALGIEEETVKSAVPVTLILIAGFLTGIGVFDKIARIAGAGTLVPITGFANAVVSPAVEFKNEGYILGVGANLFKIAGPVIAYGSAASIIYGIIYYILKVTGAV